MPLRPHIQGRARSLPAGRLLLGALLGQPVQAVDLGNEAFHTLSWPSIGPGVRAPPSSTASYARSASKPSASSSIRATCAGTNDVYAGNDGSSRQVSRARSAGSNALRASSAEVIQRATVWSLDRNLEIGISVGGASAFVKASRVILATGALERPFPIPGWTLPGVMTAGAAQTMLKSSALVPDGPTVIAGQGPLLWLLAAQILRLGGRIDCILDTTARGNYLAALPHAFGFLTSPYFAKGLAMMREVLERRFARLEQEAAFADFLLDRLNRQS